MLMTSVSGHLMEREFAPEYRGSWQKFDPKLLFTAPVVKEISMVGPLLYSCWSNDALLLFTLSPLSPKPDIGRTLQNEIRKAHWLVLWLDCDREGENIAYEVIDVCKKVKPNLTIKRAHFSSLIARHVLPLLSSRQCILSQCASD